MVTSTALRLRKQVTSDKVIYQLGIRIPQHSTLQPRGSNIQLALPPQGSGLRKHVTSDKVIYQPGSVSRNTAHYSLEVPILRNSAPGAKVTAREGRMHTEEVTAWCNKIGARLRIYTTTVDRDSN